MDDAKVFGEVSRRVRRFKLDISTPKSPSPSSDESSASATATTNAVYSHISGGIGNIPQLRGLRSAGRRGYRLIRKNGSSPETELVKEYTKAISILTPMFVEETQKKIIAKGKEPQNKYAAEINKKKNRPTYQLAKRRRLEEEQAEPAEEIRKDSDSDSDDEPIKVNEKEPEKEEETKEDITELTEEEIKTKLMREEVLAAIAAITAGIEQEEMLKTVYQLAKKK